MKVNTNKTYIVVYRHSRQRIPQHVSQHQWYYQGSRIEVKTSFKYLGIMFHQSKGAKAACAELTVSGIRAMHALLTQCKKSHISQSDFQIRLFKVLVEPVLSYGCQVWGPDVCLAGITNLKDMLNVPQEKVQLNFLRILGGLPSSACKWVTLMEFGTQPLQFHWLALCARFWSKLKARPDDVITKQALHDNILLYMQGCTECWCFKFLEALHEIGGVRGLREADTLQKIVDLDIQESDVLSKLQSFYYTRIWGNHLHPNPTIAPSNHVVLSTYKHWVKGPLQARKESSGAPHLKAFLPHKLKSALVRLRVGSFDLNIHTGRFHRMARTDRKCKACICGQVEDLQHFLRVCPAYTHIRHQYHDIFNSTSSTIAILGFKDQVKLAKCIFRMFEARDMLLLLRQQNPAAWRAQCSRLAGFDSMLDSFESDDSDC